MDYLESDSLGDPLPLGVPWGPLRVLGITWSGRGLGGSPLNPLRDPLDDLGVSLEGDLLEGVPGGSL